MSAKTVGYFVLDGSSVCEIGHYDDTPRAGILLNGNTATLFKSRASARRAIERTETYGTEKNLRWLLRHRIERLTEPSHD